MTNLKLEDKLISQARMLGHHKTKEEAVITALQEYIDQKKQLDIIKLFGKIDFDEEYNYKKARKT